MLQIRPVEFAHWHRFFEDLPISPTAFYASLEAELASRRVPDTKACQTEYLEGGLLSSKRLYLQVRRDWLTYHICIAPFGTGFFVSSRLLVSPFGTWPILIGIVAGIGTCLGFLFIVVAAITNSVGIGLVAVAFFSFPAFCVFVLAVLIWIILCLRLTYYRLDTMFAFEEAVHRILVAALNKIVEAKGRKPLSDAESKPVFHRLLRR